MARKELAFPISTFLAGLAIGAGLTSILDPSSGRRRRTMIRDKAVSTFSNASDSVGAFSRNLSKEVKGKASDVVSWFKSDAPVSDDVLVQRVRSRLGRTVSHASSLEVQATDGEVLLRGPILSDEVDKCVSIVESTRGVKGVRNELEVHERQ